MIFHPEARTELSEAASYYAQQEPGLGERFLRAIESGLRQVERSPNTWRCLRGDIRRFLVKTFPYGIIYAGHEEPIFIIAIMHLKREPDYWRGRLNSL